MRVRDVMTRGPVHVRPETPVRNARWLMHLYSIQHLPVVEPGRPVAMLSYETAEAADKLSRRARSGPPNEHGAEPLVQALDPPPVPTVNPDEPLDAAARLLRVSHAKALAVMEEGRIVGVISTDQLQQAIDR